MELNRLYNMDCMEGMKQFPDKFFDLAIVDPPYGIGEDGRSNHTRSKLARAKDYRSYSRYDSAIPDQKYFNELSRVSTNQIIWGGNYFIGNLAATSCFIVWDKDNGDNDFADCELAWTSFKTSVRRFKYRWNGMIQENMKLKEKRIHPNHKPVALYKWILSKYGKPGYKIIDTHAGSSSSLIACMDMGFEFIGFEIDSDYCEAATKRMEEYKAQLKLF